VNPRLDLETHESPDTNTVRHEIHLLFLR